MVVIVMARHAPCARHLRGRKDETRLVSNSWDGRRPNDVRVDDEGISVPVEEGIYRARGYQPPLNELPWEEDYLRQQASARP
jgi:hypothetical protein